MSALHAILALACLALTAALPGAESGTAASPGSPAAASTAATAAASDLPALPADRTWLLRLDVREIGRSGLAPLLERIDNAPQTSYLEDIGHLQVSRDIASVLLSGTYAPDSGVAYCAGTFDVDALHELVENIPDHAQRSWHGHRLDTWQGPNDAKPSWACLVSDRLLLFGRAEAQLDSALDALDGSGTALAPTSALLGALPAPADALAVGAAVDLASLPAARKHSLVMKHILDLALVVRQAGSELKLQITGATTAEAVAKRLSRLVSGLQAMAQLSVEDTPAHPLLALLVDHAAVSNAGVDVLIDATLTPAEVIAALDARDAARPSRGIHGQPQGPAQHGAAPSASSGGVRP